MALKFEVRPSGGAWTDRSAYVNPRSIRITRQVKGQSDQLAVVLEGLPRSLEPVALSAVRLRDDSAGTLYFAGMLVEYNVSEHAQTGDADPLHRVTLSCQGWQFDMDRRIVRQAFAGGAAGARVRSIIDNVVNPGRAVEDQFTATTATVPDGPTIAADSYDELVAPALDRIAAAADFDWWVDASKIVYFQPRAGSGPAAPWVVDSTSTITAPVKLTSGVQIRNHVEVIGGTLILPADGSDFVDNFVGDGVASAYKLRYQPLVEGTFTFYRNDAGAIDEGVHGRTVGVEGKDDPASVQWLINYASGTVRRGTDTIPPSGANLRGKYKYMVTAIAQDEDSVSIAAYGRFDHLERDDSILSTQLAMDLAARHLAQSSQPQVEFSFSTARTGLRPGQLLTVNLPTFGFTSTRKTIRAVREVIEAPSTGPLTLLNYLWRVDVEAV